MFTYAPPSTTARTPIRSPAGVALDPGLRSGAEAAFATDFAGVRIHATPSLPVPGADAVAFGEQLFFRARLPDPRRAEDRDLLLHELSHVTQHRDGTSRRPGVEGAAEQRVERAARGLAPARGVPTVVAPVALGGKKKRAQRKKAKENHQRLIAEERAAEARRDERLARKGNGVAQENVTRRNLRTPGLDERMRAHDFGPEFDAARDGELVRDLHGQIGQQKAERRERKIALMTEAYQRRATYSATTTFKDRLDPAHPDAAPRADFKAWFGQTGDYVPQMRSAQVHNRDVVAPFAMHRGVTLREDAERQETHVLNGGRHVYTLFRGASGYQSDAEASGLNPRTVYRKRDGARTDGGKHYVRDDRGTFTPRYATSVKGGGQVDLLRRGSTLRGKFVTPVAWSAENKARHQGESNLADVGDREVLGGTTPPTRPSSEEVMRATPTEQASFGVQPRPGAYHTNIDDMLFTHQWQGSDDRQRGVSASTTRWPLLSNDANGFATGPDHRPDPSSRRLTIDLARIPPSNPRGLRGSREPAPNLYNYHAADNLRYHPIYKVGGGRGRPTPTSTVAFPPEGNRSLIQWSTGKNREIFLKDLPPSAVVEEQRPHPLEDMSYIGSGWDGHRIAQELHGFKQPVATARAERSSGRDEDRKYPDEERKYPDEHEQHREERREHSDEES